MQRGVLTCKTKMQSLFTWGGGRGWRERYVDAKLNFNACIPEEAKPMQAGLMRDKNGTLIYWMLM